MVFLRDFLGFTDHIRTVAFQLCDDPSSRFLQRVTLISFNRQDIASLCGDDLLSDRSLAICSVNRYKRTRDLWAIHQLGNRYVSLDLSSAASCPKLMPPSTAQALTRKNGPGPLRRS